jgi:predicted glycoside hydrolase/deacetylase ChbG (UPF0249 family)
MYVVINCDDLGLHPAVRRAVRELGREGAISSATVLANGPDFEESARVKEVGIGVHLNLLRGRPICPPERIPSLVGEDGLLLRDYGRLFRRYAAGRISVEEVRRECNAQVERVMDAGIRPTHLDSEKHIHAWPLIGAVAADVARRYRIRWMRRPVERLRSGVSAAGLLRIAALRVFSLAGPPVFPEVMRPDGCWGIADQGALLDPGRFLRYAEAFHKMPKALEIVCHPGMPEEGDPPIDPVFGSLRVAAVWEAESAALRDPAWKRAFEHLKAQMVDFGGIPE